jgi:hypothetical protein
LAQATDSTRNLQFISTKKVSNRSGNSDNSVRPKRPVKTDNPSKSAKPSNPSNSAKPSNPSNSAKPFDSAKTSQSENRVKEVISLPLFKYAGPIILLQASDDQALLYKLINNEKILGFDTETRPVFTKGRTKPVALVQIATSEHVILIRLNKGILSAPLARLIEDPEYTLTGFGIFHDFIDIDKNHIISPKNYIDLNRLQKHIGISGMQRSAAHFLNCSVSKSKARSNWEASSLKEPQLIYAATDAWISREVCVKALKEYSSLLAPEDDIDFRIEKMKLLMGRKNYRVLDMPALNLIMQALMQIKSEAGSRSTKRYDSKEHFFKELLEKIVLIDPEAQFSKADISGTTRILKSAHAIAVKGGKKVFQGFLSSMKKL